MAMVFNCDLCGEITYINPPVELLFDEEITEMDVPFVKSTKIGSDGKPINKIGFEKKIVKNKVPKMTTMKRQNPINMEMEEIPIQDQIDLKPRAYIVRLFVGQEGIQKDFCKLCLDTIMPEIKALMNKLEKIRSK